MEWLKTKLRAVGKRTRGGASPERCCVPGCAATLLIPVAGRGSAKTMMCQGHARQWVASDLCWRIAEDATGALEANLISWTQARRRPVRPGQPSLRAV